MFPTWALTELSQAEGVPIVSSFELEGLLALCRLKVRVRPLTKSIYPLAAADSLCYIGT